VKPVSWEVSLGGNERDVTEISAQGRVAVAARPIAPLVSEVEREVTPAKRRLKVRDLLREGQVISVLASRDFKVKYKQSALGPLWLVFQPLALLAAFFVAFRGLADVTTSGIPYAPFALVGLTVWAFFQASMTIGSASVITNVAFVRYTPCPRPAFPLAAIIASLPSYAVTAVGAIATAAASGILSPRVVLLPLAFIWLNTLTVGLVGVVSALAVRYRDIVSALPFLLQVGLFVAPVGFSTAELSDTIRAIVDLNPLTGVIEATRWMMLQGYYPSFGPIALSLVESVVVLVVGWLVFTRLETTMADEI
jgi:ABC-type polysaccharide/polyol phosphate export permease